jgi:biotin carboxylase
LNNLGIGTAQDVLVQEFLQGKEYVVDKVSKDGVHKIVAVWAYDKRPVNGASFVYFGMSLLPSDTKMAQELIQYADGVLDALGIVQGPSHMEVMYCADGPCLVEVGSRCHGGEGVWLNVAQECVGYTVVTVTADVYTNGPIFDTLPAKSYTKHKAGREVDLVCRQPGIIRGIPGESKIKALASFRSINWEAKVGDFVPVTIDCFTRPGSVQLVNDSEEDIQADLEAIHHMEEQELFDYSVICPSAPIIGAVVVVDPFSTGANLAAAVLKWGYKLIIVFSDVEDSGKEVLSRNAHLPSTLHIQYDSKAADPDKAIQDTIDKLQKQPAPVLAILAGAQTGTKLAEVLAARYKTRNNGLMLVPIRHDKVSVQSHLASTGISALKQQFCTSEEEVRSFLHSLDDPHAKCVVKPRDSTSTDGVQMLHNAGKEDNIAGALAAFRAINGKENAFGKINNGAIVQEFLTGAEFIVDAVSRDGVYKVVAVWEYQRRAGTSDTSPMYQGMRLRAVDSAEMKAIVNYAEFVSRALGYINGPTHMEVVLTSAGPRMLEVSGRCHGGLGTWLPIVQECIGKNELSQEVSTVMS